LGVEEMTTEPEEVAEAVLESDVLDSARAGGLAIRGGALRALAYFAAMLLSLASVPFMIRHLGATDYGYFVTVSSITFIIAGFTEAGLTFLGMREYSLLHGDERVIFLRNLVGLRLTLTVAGVAAAVVFTAVTGQPGVVVVGVLIAGVGSLLAMTQQTYAVALSAQLRLGWVSALELIKNATISLATIALVFVSATLVPFYFTSVLAGLVMLAITLLVLRSEAGLLPRFDVARWRSMLPGLAPYALAAGVGVIYFRLAVVLMSYIATSEETGIYSAAYRIVETLAALPWLVVSAGFPILARAHRDDSDRLRYGVRRLFDVSLLIGVWLALVLAISAPFAIRVVAGPGFEASVAVLQLLSLSIVTSFLVATWSFTLLTMHAYRALLVGNALAALTSAALTLTLVPELGARGAAIATFGAEATLALAYIVSLGQRDRQLLPPVRTAARLLPGIAAALAVGALLSSVPVIAAAAAGLAYAGCAFAFGAVPRELMLALLHRRPEPGSARDA
jgi:O-antigen/teichoic acid export membrane protein